MQQLPKKINWDRAQDLWAAIINPLLSNPAASPSILKNISLVPGANSIPHKLGQKLQGWYITRMRANFAQIYDTQDTNPYPALNLNLNASANVVVDIAVY